MQLLDSFGKIASGSSGIMYSTHSHYMVNPEWLDQAFVIANSAIDYESPADELVPESPSTEIRVDRYRSFVGQNPTKTTYFQPVLDKLEATPSRLDLLRPAVLVEGKGDFFILEYGRRVVLGSSSSYAVVPTRGAADMDVLVGLFCGWGIDFAICLDSDKAGRMAKRDYLSGWGLASDRVFTLADISTELDDARIEDFLDETDQLMIARSIGIAGKPSKSQVQLFYSEALARRAVYPASPRFRRCIEQFDAKMREMLEQNATSDKPPKTKKSK
jgi:hypothetical protein